MAADLVLDSLDTDILVLGAGGAGLCAALHRGSTPTHREWR
jgi:succinate dehydrogenase/fumarate reductase flavoprotein subunit